MRGRPQMRWCATSRVRLVRSAGARPNVARVGARWCARSRSVSLATMEPSDLASELRIDPKKLRAWLRRTYPRSLVDHNSRWSLTTEQVNAARSHFGSKSQATTAVVPAPPPATSLSPAPLPSGTVPGGGSLWERMHVQPGREVRTFSAATAPASPGVYAFYRDGVAMYIGRAVTDGGLRSRLRTHRSTGVDLSHSSFRRNVAEHLGVAPTSITRMRPPQLTEDQVAPINEWIAACTVRWLTAASVDAAKQLEDDIKSELKLPLTKR